MRSSSFYWFLFCKTLETIAVEIACEKIEKIEKIEEIENKIEKVEMNEENKKKQKKKKKKMTKLVDEKAAALMSLIET